MSSDRVRVLEIGAEGAGFELDAELDDNGSAHSFFPWAGGAHAYERVNEEQQHRLAHGPLGWSDVLETWLRPHQWLEQYPRVIHPSIAELVRNELPHASEEGRARWSSALKPAMLRASIQAAYDKDAHRIHPFIGDAFAGGPPGALRVMTIGINAYLSEADWAAQRPGWFGGWFRDGTHKFDRTVARDAGTIARALVGSSAEFSGLSYAGKENIFHTNAVKAYLRKSEGQRSNQLTRQHFEVHVPTWHAELDAMAEHRVLPHVVIIFGQPFWGWARNAFRPEARPAFKHLTVHGFVSAHGDGRDNANRIEVESAAGKHTLALLGVRHPAARATSKAQPEWLVSCSGMRELFGLPAI